MSNKELQIKEKEAAWEVVYNTLAKLTGSNSVNITKTHFDQLYKACNGKMDIVEILENIKEIAPKDHVERMLAVQMIATHSMMMRCLARSAQLWEEATFQLIDLGDNTLKLADKLARTYAMQMEALSRYRNKGKQKMTIEHVHINSGGKAVIGSIDINKAPEEGGGVT